MKQDGTGHLVQNSTPAIKHFQTCTGDKMRLVKMVRRAWVALHLHLAEVGQAAKNPNNTVQIEEIVGPSIKHFKQLARHQSMQRVH